MIPTNADVLQELTGRILPFWKGLRDDDAGGYVGWVDFDLTRHPERERGCILNSRILWFFSECARVLGETDLLREADHAYEMLRRMTDKARGGVYWSVRPDGTVCDGTKHTYNQAFAVYALSAYAQASGKEEPLKEATALFELIEKRCFDGDGYREAFTADWQPTGNEKLSDGGVEAQRTMNTLLHVLEGYTRLYEAGGDPRVGARLRFILDVWDRKIYNPEKRQQEVFFDYDYRSLEDIHSFGHDIETSWLMDHTLDVLGDEALTARIRPKLMAMAEHTLNAAFTDHGFANERRDGVIDATRVWWVQAEALLGFLNAWERTGQEQFQEAVARQWAYIQNVMADPRPGSEWYWCVREDGAPIPRLIVEPWKCPYHNGRMCLELLKRGQETQKDM